MTDVVIKKLSNVFIQIQADAGIRMGLSEYFSRYVKGYMFSPKYKAKVWDGKIRLFKYLNGAIYAGLIKDVLEYCKEEGLSTKVEPEVMEMFRSGHDPSEYISKLKLHAHGKEITLRDYQLESVKRAIQQKRILIQSPTSSGKSAVIYCIVRYLLDEVFDNQSIMIVVPTIGLVTQLTSDFKDYSVLNGWDVDSFVGQSTAKDKGVGKKVLITTWQSVYKNSEAWFSKYDALLMDEVHGVNENANAVRGVGEKCNAQFRIGLSGSINFEDNEAFEYTLRGLFGFIFKATTTKELMNRGEVAQLNINCIHLKYRVSIKKTEYQQEMEWIVSQIERNKLILDMANSVDGNVLLLFNLVEKHGKPLYAMAKALEKEGGKEAFFVYGGTDVDQRENIRKIAETHKGCIIIASYKTFSTGISIRNLHNIFFGSPTKSFTRVIQSIGRGLRMSETKLSCHLYDFFDELHGNPKDSKSYNHTFKHFIERVKIYVKEGFKYKIHEVIIEN